MSNDPIPLVDLAAQHRDVSEVVAAGFADVLATTAFINGPAVAQFEADFARFCGIDHCVGVGNGTDAIEMAIRALGVGRGDEVIAPANTFIATVEAIARAGATVRLVDCDPETYLIDPGQVHAVIGPRTRAVVGVDLYGQIAPFDRLGEIAGNERIALLEDAAQSQGATRFGHPIGTGVAAAATSFYPGKNLGAYGDAGAVITADAALATRIREIGGHGGTRRYEHDVFGFNSRLDTLQAVVLSAKLAHLATWNDRRRAAAARYDELLAGVDQVALPIVAEGNEHVWHLYVVRVQDRDRVLAVLNQAGIGAGIHYPAPVHLTGAFADLADGPGSFPIAEASAPQLLTLPLFPHITAAQQERVVECLRGALRGSG